MNETQRTTNVLFLTRYDRQGASSRYRFLQFIPALEEAGFRVETSPLFDDAYFRQFQRGCRQWRYYVRALLSRAAAVREVRRFDLVVLEKELLPYIPSALEWRIRERPVLVDYDDAIFHQYDQHRNPLVRAFLGKKIAAVMGSCSLVVAGNRYIGEYARQAGARRVAVLPTVVDPARYVVEVDNREGPFTIGWIGSPSTSRYLEAIAPALAEVCRGGRGRVLLIGACDVRLPDVPFEILPWSDETEVRDLARFDVGIMPLPDEPWARGKCGFKLIQYMARGLPVVASPVGVNEEIVDANVGFLADSEQDWVDALETLRGSPDLRRSMGAAGRAKVEAEYSLRVVAPKLIDLCRSVIAEARIRARVSAIHATGRHA